MNCSGGGDKDLLKVFQWSYKEVNMNEEINLTGMHRRMGREN
jgi:hypothetical protein